MQNSDMWNGNIKDQATYILGKSLPKVIWQKAKLPSCHVSCWQIHSYTVCNGQTYLPCTQVHMLQWHTLLLKVPLPTADQDPHVICGSFAPQMKSQSVQLCLHRSLTAQHTDIQTDRHTDHATCVIWSNRQHAASMHCMQTMQHN